MLPQAGRCRCGCLRTREPAPRRGKTSAKMCTPGPSGRSESPFAGIPSGQHQLQHPTAHNKMPKSRPKLHAAGRNGGGGGGGGSSRGCKGGLLRAVGAARRTAMPALMHGEHRHRRWGRRVGLSEGRWRKNEAPEPRTPGQTQRRVCGEMSGAREWRAAENWSCTAAPSRIGGGRTRSRHVMRRPAQCGPASVVPPRQIR
eukprot:COSAG01_NODE_8717_length_2687_cov_1.817233_3_plen_200_part_00